MLRIPATLGRYHRRSLQYVRTKIPHSQYDPVIQLSVVCFSNSKQPENWPEKQETKSEEKPGMLKTVQSTMKSGLSSMIYMVKNPKETWKSIKEVADHYWLGSKLLWSDIKVATDIVGRILEGHSMTRRERIQLVRTTTDIFRLVPFSIFIIIPFMELLLPFALKLFPNMLPSTFQDSLKAEESMKKELQMRLAIATFMQETLQQMAEKKQSSSGDGSGSKEARSGAREVIEFVEKARLGEHIPKEQVMRIAKLFQDELTLANVTRPQLMSMCQYMGLQPYGADSFLRFQLRAKLRALQEDDRRILWEGIDSLNTIELRDACRERGMRSIGMTQFRLKKQLQEWLELSTQKGIPIFLLIMSRAFMLSGSATGSHAGQHGVDAPLQAVMDPQPSDAEQVLKSSMSFLDSDTINEVVLEAASRGEVDSAEMRRRRLESIQFQKELMQEERQEQEGVSKAKKTSPLPHTASTQPAGAQDTAAAHTKTIIAGQERVEEVVGDRATIASSGAGSIATTKPLSTFVKEEDTATTSEIVAVHSQPTSLMRVKGEPSRVIPPATQSATEAQPETLNIEQSELTLHELITLSDLARGNSLRREMSELALLEAFIESLPIGDTVDKSSKSTKPATDGALDTATQSRSTNAMEEPPVVLVDPSPADGWGEEIVHSTGAGEATVAGLSADKKVSSPTEDKSVTMMKSAISAMVSKLKVKINTTEKVLGDKLRVLDRDGDGQISLDEIKEVLSTVMKRGAATEESTQQLFSLLDSNKDGKVSVGELLHYIHKKRESKEAELMEAQMQAAAAAAAEAAETQNTNSSCSKSSSNKPQTSSTDGGI